MLVPSVALVMQMPLEYDLIVSSKCFYSPATREMSMRQLISGWGHLSVWTIDVLDAMLFAAGFTDRHECLYGCSGHEELQGVDGHHMQFSDEEWEIMKNESVIVEAMK